MNNISYTNTDLGIKYNKLIHPQISTGVPFSIEPYQVENGELKKYPLPLINATDINWGGVNINDSEINTTDDLLYLLSTKGTGNSDIDIDSSTILSVMLKTISALQTEVIKLRNSFRFGINSYTNEDFGMSQTVDELQNIQEEEPLWATDESELSFVEGLDLSQDTYQYITPIDNFSIIKNEKLKYTDQIMFTIPTDSDNKSILETSTDPKQYMYITCTTKDIDILLNSENSNIVIHINDIVRYNYTPEKYNILLIVSKQVENKKQNGETELIGNNFIWLSVSEWGTGTDLFNGYIDDSGNVDYETSETPIYLDNIYNISEITFNTTTEDYIYKLNIYTRYQDFSKTIEAATPTDIEDYKYRTAAITIRSMSTEEKIRNNMQQLQNNELIFCEANKKLYIYTNGKLINIGSGGSSDSEPTDEDIMENYEILKALEEQGIISIIFKDADKEPENLKYDDGNIDSYILTNKFSIKETLNDIEKIKFINGDTGKKFDITMDPYGEFNIKEELTTSMQDYITKSNNESWFNDLPGDYKTDRSFVSILKATKKNKDITKDMKLDADHIRIGAIYAPMKTDKIHGCTHGYIELVNSSNEDFYLDGSYLHYSYVDNASENTLVDEVTYKMLPLDGFIPAGGTYLIRCKQYSTIDDPNTFIDVKTYDKEWYDNGELLDLSISKTCSLGLAFTYGNTVNGQPINADTTLATKIPTTTDDTYKLSGKGTYVLAKGMIDACYIGKDWGALKNHWITADAQGVFTIYSNTIYKVTFELDPAKQAFNSWTTADSSRSRWQNSGTDYQYVNLDREYIEFPKTDIKKAVSDYTPKASFEHKNVITDKTKLDKTKPNAIVCSFGINPYTTRCFNWVSSGLFNEAVVIIDPDTNKEYVFESYKNVAEPISQKTTFPRRKEFSVEINNIVYGSGKLDEVNGEHLYNKFPGNNEPYTSHKCIVDIVENSVDTPKTYSYYVCRLDNYGVIDNTYKSDIRTFTLYPESYTPRIYQVTDQQGFHWIEYQVWAASAKKIDSLIKEHQADNNIMPIIINTGDAVQSGARVNEWLDYFIAGEYLFTHYEQMNIVGNNDLCDTDINKLGTGDDTGKSNGYFFHLFNCYEIPTDEYRPIVNNVYVPSLYYMDVHDDKGITRMLFINSEITTINCRDWYKINHNGNPVNIYTGYTITTPQEYAAVEKYTQEKANQYNLTLDGALQYGDIKIPAVEGIHFTQEEIDAAQEGDEAYDKTIGDWQVEPVEAVLYTDDEVNTYNSELPGAKTTQDDLQLFHPIYEILYNWTSNLTSFLPVCHEMPFTVVTNNCLSWTLNTKEYGKFRSLSDTGTLIGSHTNQIDATEKGKGMHWMSRLFEYRGITLCLGGHKHTYACTYPARENYLYTENDITKWSYKDGPMTMPASLKNDTANWTITINIGNETREINLSKFPIVKRQSFHKELDLTAAETINYTYDGETIPIKISIDPKRFYPFVDAKDNDDNTFVIYLMCQATGYKLTSNKELPSEFQKFSMVIPKSYIDKIDAKGKTTDKPSSDQQMPMFCIIDIMGNNEYHTQLARINNISNSKKKLEFTQLAHNRGTNNQLVEYLIMAKTSINGLWAYYNSSTNNFVQTDTFADSKISLNYVENSTTNFNIEDNTDKILYPNLINSNNIYLFCINKNGMIETL